MTLDKDALKKASETYQAPHRPGGEKFPHLRAAITAYLTERRKTHVEAPRELDEDILEGMFARTEGFPMSEMDEIHAALIAELDAR